ncbi:hypothetical protein, partial [Streptomyces sp. uw30]|uniref:hypothetical protein n=1 Tax=Streptomyces sp. uw30 TaxID=1828179 RepID=UPI001C9BBE7C
KPLTGPDGYVFALAFTSDGTGLAATAGDGTVWLWNQPAETSQLERVSLTLWSVDRICLSD